MSNKLSANISVFRIKKRITRKICNNINCQLKPSKCSKDVKNQVSIDHNAITGLQLKTKGNIHMIYGTCLVSIEVNWGLLLFYLTDHIIAAEAIITNITITISLMFFIINVFRLKYKITKTSFKNSFVHIGALIKC